MYDLLKLNINLQKLMANVGCCPYRITSLRIYMRAYTLATFQALPKQGSRRAAPQGRRRRRERVCFIALLHHCFKHASNTLAAHNSHPLPPFTRHLVAAFIRHRHDLRHVAGGSGVSRVVHSWIGHPTASWPDHKTFQLREGLRQKECERGRVSKRGACISSQTGCPRERHPSPVRPRLHKHAPSSTSTPHTCYASRVDLGAGALQPRAHTGKVKRTTVWCVGK